MIVCDDDDVDVYFVSVLLRMNKETTNFHYFLFAFHKLLIYLIVVGM